MDRDSMPVNRGSKKFRSIGRKVGIVVAVMQLVSVVVAMVISVWMFSSLITRMQQESCVNGTSIWFMSWPSSTRSSS